VSLYSELKRRNVIRVAIAYVAASWLLIQVIETLFPIYGLSDAAIRLVVAVLAIGFIPAMIISWAFERTPSGLRRDADVERSEELVVETARRSDRIILVLLAMALGYFAVDKFVIDPGRDTQLVTAATEQALSRARIESFGEKSIAVLPFVNMSSDPEQTFFSDGISEELLNLLAKIPQLRVTSRSSAFSFRGDNINIPDVAKILNVAHVLEGSVRRSGNQIRITAQLIEARSDTHLWSETYDRPFEDIFAIQDEVAAEVVKQLRLALLGDVPTTRKVDVRAYPLYLQARQIVGLMKLDELAMAEDLLNQALEIDPNYDDALVTLIQNYWYQRYPGFPSAERADELDRLLDESMARAKALNPNNAGLMTLLAWSETSLDEQARLNEKAAEIEPSNFDSLRLSADLATKLGDTDLAFRIYEYLAPRNPLEIWVHLGRGETYLAAGRSDEAIEHFEIAARLSVDTPAMNWKLGVARIIAGDPEGAIDDFEREPSPVYKLQGMTMALHDLGRKDESAAAMAALHAIEKDATWPFGFARAYAWIGNSDEAFRYLQMDREASDGRLDGAGTHPVLVKLHDDPRWIPFLRSVNGAPDQLAEIAYDPRFPDEL